MTQKSSKNTNLRLVPSALQPGPTPPRPLGEHGMSLWHRITGAYSFTDEGSLEMLSQACAALDRAEQLAAEIARSGVVMMGRGGVVRENPAVKAELAHRAFLTRTLSRLGLCYEPVRQAGGQPLVY